MPVVMLQGDGEKSTSKRGPVVIFRKLLLNLPSEMRSARRQEGVEGEKHPNAVASSASTRVRAYLPPGISRVSLERRKISLAETKLLLTTRRLAEIAIAHHTDGGFEIESRVVKFSGRRRQR